MKITYKNEICNRTARSNICERLWILSFPKNMGKSLSNRYGQKLFDSAKKSTTGEIKQHQKEQFKKQLKQLVI